ncbi:MAG: VWA domain-containing protein [Myxococcota bacterium]
MTEQTANRRQLLFWRTLLTALGDEKTRDGLEAPVQELIAELGLPRLVLDPRAPTDQVLKRAKKHAALLKPPRADDALSEDDQLRRVALSLKATLNVFGKVGGAQVSAAQYTQWLADVRAFELANGYAPGTLLRGAGGASGQSQEASDDYRGGTSGDIGVEQAELEEALAEIDKGEGLMAEPEIRAGLQGIEKRLIDRMQLREVLKDAKLAAKLTPSMALTEQLLRDKGHLEGPALANAKRLIQRYVDELGEILAREVESSVTGKLDTDQPPKRTFSNLDLKRTLWRNLTNWDPESQRLYVDRLYYHRHAKRINKTELIVVVDQSGSMVPAMVNCAILASIFAGLPKVEGRIIAFDTRAIDLTPWVRDPFECLLRTQLGGGNDGLVAVPHVQGYVRDPRNTVVVWVSDFYDTHELMPVFTRWVRSGITFVPVGSVSSSGFFSVEPWFRRELKALGTPVLSGSLRTLIRELKSALP